MYYFHTHPSAKLVPLDPKLKAIIETLPPKDFSAPIEQWRATSEKQAVARPKLNATVEKIENRVVPGPGGEIPIRLYTPKGIGPLPILVYIHGGGWVMGSLDTHDDICRSLCNRSGSMVVSVGYRLAPEHKYPAAVEDCYAVLKWVAEKAAAISGDAKRIAISGDSSGGNIAAAVALRSRDQNGPKLALQVLIYPVANYGFDTASYHRNAAGYDLTRDAMIWFWTRYLPSPEYGDEPCASPLRAKDLTGLPPALVLTAQYDPLCDDGEAYAARLHSAGVPVRVTRYLDMNHGFFNWGAVCKSADCAFQEAADTLKEAFRR